jgi:hypothetical protein
VVGRVDLDGDLRAGLELADQGGRDDLGVGDTRLAAANVDGELELELGLHVHGLAGCLHLDDRRRPVDAFVGESLGGRLGGIEPGRTLEVAYDPANPKQVELT